MKKIRPEALDTQGRAYVGAQLAFGGNARRIAEGSIFRKENRSSNPTVCNLSGSHSKRHTYHRVFRVSIR